MYGLYRSGRQADALRAYQRLRTQLDDELGIEPSPTLRHLEQAILEQDPSIEWSGFGVATAEALPGGPAPGAGRAGRIRSHLAPRRGVAHLRRAGT